MTIRYHTRGGKELPTYVCQRDGIANGHAPCTLIPGHTLDERISGFLISQLTPLAAEAALTVSAELRHRAAQAGALRAAHVERARYHADLARRRYLAVDPANRLVAGTLEADWNTALRALNDAQATYDKAREQHPGQLTEEQKTRIRQLVTDLPGIWNDPATPMRERKRIARLLLTDVTVTRTSDTITAHIRLPRRPAPHPGPPRPQARLGTTPDRAQGAGRHRRATRSPHPRRNRRHPQRPRPDQRRRPRLPPAHHPQHPRRLPAAQPRATTPRRRHAHPGRDRRAARRVHRNHQDLAPRRTPHRAPLQRQRPVPLPPPGPNPPARAQGRKLSERRPAPPADDA